ncbi:hypothetical protein MSG28_010341 [Choristoneura fumiferana]|uniref:Uncharacterized protein n=1 Tax=Choristoneura fumiferana TaxID=7141 RepID=A0ACC0KKT9_CHOFU|nr:hypothetical protein MSG28_010341 [Choristoneura fumiferana]
MVIAKSKKLKPQMNNTNTIKNMDYNWAAGPEPPNNQDVGVPKAVFVPHANSLPFEERRVTLEQSIGRNVYRATPSPTNAIFECRVLSRHHATLYYEKGHFYLVDNQSSNGTFINNNRCSISKEQEPHEVFSGDVNTFPPVVALLKLYHPDGMEAKLSFNPTMTTPLHLKELYQLNNFVQARLRALRDCVQRTQAEARDSWELFVGEQRLLMRVHTLETMLAVGKQPEAQHVAQLLSDKRNYQEVATESLRAAHEQRLALEETLERRGRESAALLDHNAALRLAATNALAELQKLAARCERKMCAARLAITAAEERELAARNHLPLAYSVQNGEAKMLVLSTDSNKLAEAKRAGSLEDAVGIKAITAEGKSAKEFELILKKNNIYDEENKEKEQSSDGEGGDDGVSGGEKAGEPESCTDDEKQSRLNHEPGHEERGSPLDGELRADNNANSTYTEPDTEDETKGGVEYANILRVMAGLNEEIRALRERLAQAAAESEQLRAAQLKRSTAVEEANLGEIQRLASNVAWMQAELAFRPTRGCVDDLTAEVAALRADLAARDTQLAALAAAPPAPDPAPAAPTTADKAIETSRSLEDLTRPEDIDTRKISAEIDEMFRLDYEDDEEETDSVATEINNSDSPTQETEASVVASLKAEATLVAGTLVNGSVHALQEELVRAKESWASASEERARLAAQLAALRAAPPRAPRLLAALVPLLAVALYLLLPHLS